MNIEKELEALRRAVVDQSPPDAVRFDVNLNYMGWNFSFDCRDPKALKRNGVSMRNLRGELIEAKG